MREPTIAWWPGKIAPGSANDAVAGNIDFLPTFVSLAGGKVPTDRKIDGRDFSPLLLGTSKQSQRDAHYYYHGNKLEAVRSGPWKLALGPQGEGRGKNGDAPDAIAPGVRLYNLDEEIGERTNLAAKHPEIVSRLQKLADAMAAELGSGKPGPACRPAGEVDQPTLLYAGKVTEQSATTAKPVDLQKLKLGETLDASSAPQIANQPFTITCDVRPEEQNGVIVAHGGKSFGYSLTLVQSQLWFSVRTRADSIATIKSDRIPEDRIEIEASLAKDGAMTLTINGKPSAKGQSPGLIPRQPQENFCVGHDDANPVHDEGGTARFKGTLEKLLVKTIEVK
jgi:arylsulfatase A